MNRYKSAAESKLGENINHSDIGTSVLIQAQNSEKNSSFQEQLRNSSLKKSKQNFEENKSVSSNNDTLDLMAELKEVVLVKKLKPVISKKPAPSSDENNNPSELEKKLANPGALLKREIVNTNSETPQDCKYR